MPHQCSGPSRPLYVVSPSTAILTGTSTFSMRMTVPNSGCVTLLQQGRAWQGRGAYGSEGARGQAVLETSTLTAGRQADGK